MYNQTIYNTAVAKGTNGYVTAADGKKTNSYEDKGRWRRMSRKAIPRRM